LIRAQLGVWTAPALPDAFSKQDVARFCALAERVYLKARQIVSALERP
jgi:hypothetical protein